MITIAKMTATLFVLLLFAGCVRATNATTETIASQPRVAPSFRPKVLALADEGSGFCQVMNSGRIRCRLMDFYPSTLHDDPPTATNFKEIVSYERGFCALDDAGAVTCWRGLGSMAKPAVRFEGKYTEIASDQLMVCALDTAGFMDCASPESDELLRDPPDSLPVRMPGGPFRNLTGGYDVCGLTDDGYTCFRGAFRGPESMAKIELDRKGSSSPGPFVKAVQTRQWSCGLSVSGTVFCKPSRFQQQISRTHDVPLRLERFEKGTYVDLIAADRVCALREAGGWDCEDEVKVTTPTLKVAVVMDHLKSELVGIDAQGDLVAPFLTRASGTSLPPLFADDPPRGGFEQVAARDGTCAIRSDETVFCDAFPVYDDDRVRGVKRIDGLGDYMMKSDLGHFGKPRRDEDGDGLVNGRNDERNKDKPGYADVQHGNDFGCGLKADGRVDCWGTIAGNARLVVPPSDRMGEIALGGVIACGITKADRSVKCWGNDYFGNRTDAPTTGKFSDLRSSNLAVCATRDDGVVSCWGSSFDGNFKTPFIPTSHVLSGAGVCGVEPETGDVQCWGLGFVWN